MWSCSRSQGQPCGERRSAMISSKSFMADLDFLNLIISKDHEVIAMNDFALRHLLEADRLGGDGDHATGEFRSVQIANSNHFAGIEISFAAGDPGREQTFAFLTKSASGAIIEIKGTFGMVKESNPAFAAGEAFFIGDKERPDLFAPNELFQDGRVFSGSNDQR